MNYTKLLYEVIVCFNQTRDSQFFPISKNISVCNIKDTLVAPNNACVLSAVFCILASYRHQVATFSVKTCKASI